MAPVKKLAITYSMFTALALVMSACAGNLEAQKLGNRTGVQKDAQAARLEANTDGATTFNEACDASQELTVKGDSETVVTAEALINGQSKKYLLKRAEVFTAITNTATEEANVVSAKIEGDIAEIICHNSKEGSEPNLAIISTAVEIDSNDGSSSQVKVGEFATANGKIGTRLLEIEEARKIQDITKAVGGQVLITTDAEGSVRIRISQNQNLGEKNLRAGTLLVYSALTAEQAEAQKAENQAAANELANEQDLQNQLMGTPNQDDNAATSSTPQQNQNSDQNDEDKEMTEEERAELEEKISKNLAEKSEELRKRNAEKLAAEQEAKSRATIAEHEERLKQQQAQQQQQQRSTPPCVRSSQDAACPNDGMAAARAAYQAQQAQSSTTTTTTQPSGRAADEPDIKNLRGH